ncbi:MAG: uridylate kinase [Gammaproteobacteria bacterium]
MIIVKIGGSLYASSYLKQWCDRLASTHQQPIVIVPGGGPFADQVREVDHKWELSDTLAHEMAVMGMQQYGCLLTHINQELKVIETINSISDIGAMVWLPYNDVVAECDYPKNWQTTSDSLALWLACKISANHLCLIKSAEIDDKSTDELINSNLVDDYFPIAIKNYSGKTHFYHASQSNNFSQDIKNGKFD